MLWKFYLTTNNKFVKKLTSTEGRKDISTDFKFWELKKNFYAHCTKFKNNPFLINKISHIFQVTTEVFNYLQGEASP
jgi:hypothetical protein